MLASRLRCLAAVLGAPTSEALALAASRPGLLLLDGPTLERRLDAVAAALRLAGGRQEAARVARGNPVWLYAELPPPLP